MSFYSKQNLSQKSASSNGSKWSASGKIGCWKGFGIKRFLRGRENGLQNTGATSISTFCSNIRSPENPSWEWAKMEVFITVFSFHILKLKKFTGRYFDLFTGKRFYSWARSILKLVFSLDWCRSNKPIMRLWPIWDEGEQSKRSLLCRDTVICLFVRWPSNPFRNREEELCAEMQELSSSKGENSSRERTSKPLTLCLAMVWYGKNRMEKRWDFVLPRGKRIAIVYLLSLFVLVVRLHLSEVRCVVHSTHTTTWEWKTLSTTNSLLYRILKMVLTGTSSLRRATNSESLSRRCSNWK